MNELFTKTEEFESEDRLIIDYGLGILLSIICEKEDCREYFVSDLKSKNLIVEGLFCQKIPNNKKVILFVSFFN